ncbi:MAG: LytTR family DNA-binding domain-containing protein, partial [Bacteroidota bacterium]
YLLKPISFPRFFKAVTKYLKAADSPTVMPVSPIAEKQSGSIYVYANKKNIKVYFEDILYIESIKDYVRIHTTGKNIISKDTITNYETLLPNSFFRIHRSFIVNSAKITAFTSHDIEIGTTELPIGTSYKKKVMTLLKT